MDLMYRRLGGILSGGLGGGKQVSNFPGKTMEDCAVLFTQIDAFSQRRCFFTTMRNEGRRGRRLGGWHRGDRAFQNLEQGVLDALPQILVASPTRLDFVDLVDENDALLGSINITVC